MSITENYKMQTIHRNEIKLADYNPRIIDEESRKRLKKAMKKFGMVQPLIYNKRTKTLVSGHQRLSIMDEEANSTDYELQVAVIDVSLEDEKKLNVQLNNTSMMGEFDDELLRNIADDIGFDDLGFSDAEIDLFFNDESFANDFQDKEEAGRSKEALKDIKEERKNMMQDKAEENSASFYFVVICQSADEREQLFREMGIGYSEEFVPATALRKLNNAK